MCGEDFGDSGCFSEGGSWSFLQERDLPEVSRWGDRALSSGKPVCLEWFPGGDWFAGISLSLEIKNASQVCCLAARLGGLLYRFRCVDNKNPDSSPVSVIWERNYRDCIQQQRYTFCFNSIILYRVSVPGTICTPHQIPCDSLQRCLLSIKMAVFIDIKGITIGLFLI